MKRVRTEGDGPILIKKYENRRLYSSTAGRHLTIAEIAELVRDGHSIQVVDASSGEDITAEILTQILLEQGRAKGLPVDFLTQMIRLQEDMLGSFVDGVIGGGLGLFWQAQKAATEAGLREITKFYDEIAKSGRTIAAPFFNVLPWMGAGAKTREASGATEEPAVHTKVHETEEALLRKVAELEAKLAELEHKKSSSSIRAENEGDVFAVTKKSSHEAKKESKREKKPSSKGNASTKKGRE